MNHRIKLSIVFILSMLLFNNCKDDEQPTPEDEIKGYNLLTEVSGHWVGSNETPFGDFDWFAFDFRPISASHIHSIYEGATNQNIITSFFIADFDGRQQIMARNGGWLGNQYRATYFVLDIADESNNRKFYRLVDAVGGEKRAYMELRFEDDKFYFDAYKDDSGQLDDPVHHMGFVGSNYNPEFATTATDLFNFPQEESEVNLDGKFVDLIDEDSALFLEESADPFPKSMHGHVSDLTLNVERSAAAQDKDLLFYLSKEPLIDQDGNVDLLNVDRAVIRTITIKGTEDTYTTTYLHPDNYYLTAFSDIDQNFFPSAGDVASVSKPFEVTSEAILEVDLVVDLEIP